MRIRLLTSVLCVLLAAAGWTGFAQEGVLPDNFSAEEPLTSFEWMVGSWRAKSPDAEREEFWTPPKGQIMLGLHRDTPQKGKAFFEYLRIEYNRDGIFYVASPRGEKTTRFQLIEVAEKKAVFFNAENKFPNKITYWLDDEQNSLCAMIQGTGNARAGARPGAGRA